MAKVYCVLNQVIILIRKKNYSGTFIRYAKQKTAQKSLLGSPQLGGHNGFSCLFPSLVGTNKNMGSIPVRLALEPSWKWRFGGLPGSASFPGQLRALWVSRGTVGG